jgi:hypothetical protein
MPPVIDAIVSVSVPTACAATISTLAGSAAKREARKIAAAAVRVTASKGWRGVIIAMMAVHRERIKVHNGLSETLPRGLGDVSNVSRHTGAGGSSTITLCLFHLLLVVFPPPGLDHGLGIGEIQEPMLTQAFIA